MRVAVLLSGGVDSSVALALLKEQGHDLRAFYLKIWLDDEMAFLGECPWEEDLKYASGVCEKLEVPLEVISLQKEYYDEVVSYAIEELKAGRTPNPDMMCNQKVKFGKFYEKVDKWCEEEGVEKYEKVASGHYAQIQEMELGEVKLKMAPDPVKDQTYFLAHLSQKQLQRVLFPIGGYEKSEVRELAEKFNLPNKNRKDSQGVCFLGKIKFRDFVKFNLGEKTGDFIEYETGEKVGEHPGFWFYTRGQRRNLRVDNGPWFVVKKDAQENIVYISRNYFEEKSRDEFEVTNLNWINGRPGDDVLAGELKVKLRHGEQMYGCKVLSKSGRRESLEGKLAVGRTNGLAGDDDCREGKMGVDENGGEVFEVKIDGQDQGISPGQFAVFYLGDVCVGSGMICG